MSSIFSIALLAVLAFTSTAQATGLDTCPVDLACCVNPSIRSLFRRTGTGDCSTKTCCQTTTNVLTTNTQKTLQCGKDSAKTSTVTVTVEDCPTIADGKCIHVAYANVGTTTFTEVHLQIDDVPITNSAPGQFSFNSYCSITNLGMTADCWVPVSKVLGVFTPPATTLCDKDIWVAAHATITDGNTCWGAGAPIVQTAKNWAMNFKVSFTCPPVCTKSCCCPEITPPTKECEFGTAFAYNAICPLDGSTACNWYLNQLGCTRWGWYFGLSQAQVDSGFTAELIVGAGQNDVTKGTHVGTASISDGPSAGTVHIAYDMDPGYEVNVAHVMITCSPVIPPPHGANPNCAPGLYTINSGCLTGGSRSHWSVDYSISCPTYYIIMHGAIARTVPNTDSCTAIDCSSTDPA